MNEMTITAFYLWRSPEEHAYIYTYTYDLNLHFHLCLQGLYIPTSTSISLWPSCTCTYTHTCETYTYIYWHLHLYLKDLHLHVQTYLQGLPILTKSSPIPMRPACTYIYIDIYKTYVYLHSIHRSLQGLPVPSSVPIPVRLMS